MADLIRDTFKRGRYQDVILPLTVLRRLDCVLAPTKPQVLEVPARFRGKLENLDDLLPRASGFAFYNTSRYDFAKLLADQPHIAQKRSNHIAGFSSNRCEVLEKFDFDNTISKLDEAGLLFLVMQRSGDPKKVNLHPDAVDNFTMGTIFEELIRKFNEALNENPGEHFTPSRRGPSHGGPDTGRWRGRSAQEGRCAPGLPRISDGQLLFLLHMLAHAKEPAKGGSRVAIIMNGSSLFTGEVGRDSRLTPVRLRRLRARQAERRLSPRPVSSQSLIHNG